MRNLNNKIYLLIDCFFINMALYIGLLVRFDGNVPSGLLGMLPFNFIIITALSLPIFYIFGIYSMLWNYASVEELIRIFLATITSSITQIFLAAYFNVLFPPSVYIIAWMITFFCGGSKIFKKNCQEFKNKKEKRHSQKKGDDCWCR